MKLLPKKMALGMLLMATISTASAAELSLRLGGPWASGSNLQKGMEKFAEVVGAETQGRIQVKVYADSQLGDIQQLLTGVQLGTVDMAYLAIGNAGQLKGGAPLNVAYVPHLFKSKQQATEALNGPIFSEMYEVVAKEAGVRIFAVYGARSPRAVQTSQGPIRKPEDLNERKWQSLKPADRELFRRAAMAGGQLATDLGEALDRDGIEILKKAGVAYVVPDRAAFNAIWADIPTPYEGKVWPAGLVQRIRATQR